MANLIDLRLGKYELSRQLERARLSLERNVVVAVQGGGTTGNGTYI